MSCPQLGDPPVHPPPHRDTGYADTVAIMAVGNATPGPSAQTITYSRREEGNSCPQHDDPPVHPPPHRDTGYAGTVAIMAVGNATPCSFAQTFSRSSLRLRPIVRGTGSRRGLQALSSVGGPYHRAAVRRDGPLAARPSTFGACDSAMRPIGFAVPWCCHWWEDMLTARPSVGTGLWPRKCPPSGHVTEPRDSVPGGVIPDNVPESRQWREEGWGRALHFLPSLPPLRVPPARFGLPPHLVRVLSRQQTTSRTGLRESPVTLGMESCCNSCRDFAGEAPTKLFSSQFGPRTRLP